MLRLYSSASVLLLASALVAQSGKEAASAEYDILRKEYAAAMAEYRAETAKVRETDEYKAAAKERDREATTKLMSTVERVDIAAFVTRFGDAAGRHAGQDEALQFHLWIIMNASAKQKDAVVVAVEAIIADHLDSEALQPPQFRSAALSRHLGQERYDEVVELIVAESPHDMVKANLLFDKAQGMIRARDASEADKAKALEMLEQVARIADGSALAQRTRAPLFKAKYLQVGMVVPDIIAADLDGVTFKLSDYRGKVVMLDFWGDW